MSSILYDLFFGDLSYNTDTFIHTPDYIKARITFDEREQRLTQALAEGEYLRGFLDLIDAHDTITGILSSEYFVLGFKIGAQMSAAALACD